MRRVGFLLCHFSMRKSRCRCYLCMPKVVAAMEEHHDRGRRIKIKFTALDIYAKIGTI